MIKTIDLGFLVAEPYAQYRARRQQCLTSHKLAEYRRCPRIYRDRELGLIPEEDTPALAFGRAFHMYVLEGRERFEAAYAVGGPTNPRTGQPFGSNTKAFAEWAAEQGRPVVAAEDFATIVDMNNAIERHELASATLAGTVREHVVRAVHNGCLCQARLDAISSDTSKGIVELKTCSDLDSFEWDARRYDYPHQLAFYRSLVLRASMVELPCYIVAVEKARPYRVGVWRVASSLLDRCEQINDLAMAEMSASYADDEWPTRYEDMRVLDITAARVA